MNQAWKEGSLWTPAPTVLNKFSGKGHQKGGKQLSVLAEAWQRLTNGILESTREALAIRWVCDATTCILLEVHLSSKLITSLCYRSLTIPIADLP